MLGAPTDVSVLLYTYNHMQHALYSNVYTLINIIIYLYTTDPPERVITASTDDHHY